jgi:NADPH:quinone reductase
MKAIQYSKLGEPNVLQLVELAEPLLQPGKVIIDVTLSGVNFADIHHRNGTHGLRTLPAIMGAEVVGRRRNNGHRVVALLPNGGGYAQVAQADEHLVYEIDDSVDDAVALALFEQGVTAYLVLTRSGRLLAGETIAIHAAMGGVGSIAVQLAKCMGASKIIALASSDAKRKMALDIGAHAAIDGDSNGLTERLLGANDGKGLDLILEMVAGPSFTQSLAALGQFGRIVTYGSASNGTHDADVAELMETNRGVVGFWVWPIFQHHRDVVESALAQLTQLHKRGLVQPLIGCRYSLDQAAEAHSAMESRTTIGKLIIDPNR